MARGIASAPHCIHQNRNGIKTHHEGNGLRKLQWARHDPRRWSAIADLVRIQLL